MGGREREHEITKSRYVEWGMDDFRKMHSRGESIISYAKASLL